MKKFIKLLSAVTVILTLTVSVIQVWAEEEQKIVRVAFPEAAGLNEIYEDGTRGGVVYEWLTEIAKYTGLSLIHICKLVVLLAVFFVSPDAMVLFVI